MAQQPMTAKEIEIWDKYALGQVGCCACPGRRAYEMATEFISARRAALIADANVGVVYNDEKWTCRCIAPPMTPNLFMLHDDEDDYCEACHTRRPDEVKP